MLITGSLGPLTEEQRHALAVSQKSAGKLESMIEDLIMFSLASRGEMSMKQETIDIERIGNLSVKTAVQKSEARGVEVHAVADPNLPFVQGDSEKIAWVMNSAFG